ncbi:uncharacterized protein [Prorops nasuta]|uniref:uncharacterized protein isoform X2 n=1 Tax=Prorops nasuta TaxID=863751 RepID=UPI0034CFF703
MEISPRKTSKRMQEPLDEWLQSEGYFRKHSPRDPTCLFRAISEQVYMTQYFHIRVRKECISFMRDMRHMFEEHISIPFENYLEQMTCFTEWGGTHEIHAMSLLYKREVIIFNSQKQMQQQITNNGFEKIILLCHTPPKQYESVYTKEYVANAAFCQSIVYQTLYKDVFKLNNIDSTVHKMLHDRNNFRHDKFFLKTNMDRREQLTTEIYSRIEQEIEGSQSVSKVAIPFPYRIAKALDPNIYRNTDFDVWHEIRREVKNAGWTKYNTHSLQIGGKCLVQRDLIDIEKMDNNNNNKKVYLNMENTDNNSNEKDAGQNSTDPEPKFYYGHIQEMGKKEDAVLVFIEELGRKQFVPYAALKPHPLRKVKQSTWQAIHKKPIDINQRCKKNNANLRKRETVNYNNTMSDHENHQNNDTPNHLNGNGSEGTNWEEISRQGPQMLNYSTDRNSNYQTKPNFSDNCQFDDSKVSYVENGQLIREDCKQNFGKYKNQNKNECLENKVNFQKSEYSKSEDNSVFPVYSESNQTKQKEIYCSSKIEYNSQALISCPPTNYREFIPNDQMERILELINSPAQKSIDADGSDLPLSDLYTLRFFYNLGLEYFRGSYGYSINTAGQTMAMGPWYCNTQISAVPLHMNSTSSESEEGADHVNNMLQASDISDHKKENLINTNDLSNDQSSSSSVLDENGVKNSEIIKYESHTYVNTKEINITQENVKDYNKEYNKDTRMSKNYVGPRFKKGTENRRRNFNNRSSNYQLHQTDQTNQFNQISKAAPWQDTKNDGAQYPGRPLQQVQVNIQNSYPSTQPPYLQQPIYNTVPIFANEGENFNSCFMPTSPIYPVPYVSHLDIPESSSMVNPYLPHICSGMDNYSQAYPSMCPQFIYPQQGIYSPSSPNSAEQWYSIPNQPQYFQYSPIPSVNVDPSGNSTVQNSP